VYETVADGQGHLRKRKLKFLLVCDVAFHLPSVPKDLKLIHAQPLLIGNEIPCEYGVEMLDQHGVEMPDQYEIDMLDQYEIEMLGQSSIIFICREI
jgi:hypothetical protein